jgi:RND family efflux transporter MFP subunit
MTIYARLFLAAALLIAQGCRPSGHEHAHDAKHTHSELPGEVVTIYTPKSELFAEHRAFVAGQETKLAAHLTDLRDWSPVSEGRAEAVLASPSGRQEVFPVEGVLRPGIFQPVVKPSAPGTYRLSVRVDSPRLKDTIDAGEVIVYADAASAIASAPEEEAAPDEIGFLKEQQWKIPFMTHPVEADVLEDGVTLQGTVKAAGGREVAISAPVNGRLALGAGSLPQIGRKVRRGELLAVLTPAEGATEDRATLRQAVRAAEATTTQARLDLARAERLYKAQAVPGKRVEEARTALTLATSQLAAAQEHLRAKEATLTGAVGVTDESFHLRAPITGTVVEAAVVPGAAVEGGAALYRLVDLSTLWVEARVPEANVNRVASADRAEVTVAGSPTVTVGRGRGGLITTGSVLDPATRTAPVVYAVPNPQGTFRIGMTAEVRALTGTTPRGPVVPKSAVVDDNGRSIAYVQTGGESFERRELRLGVKQGDRVQVLSGLKPGDRIVTQGGYEIRLSTLSNAVPAHGHEH